MDHCEIIENSAVNYGGGICFDGFYEMSEINNSEISFNNSSNGGGLVCKEYSKPVLKNVIIANNNATSNGGGIFCQDGNPSLYNVTLSGNNASSTGGGICLFWESFPVFINSILWDNSPQEVGFKDEDQPGFEIPTKISFSYCDVQGGEDGINPLSYDILFWLEGNIDQDPLFAGAGDDPFSLLEDSPAIDSGTPDTAGLNLPLTDYLGNFRIWDGDGDDINTIDMGAYEFGSLPVGTDKHSTFTGLDICVYPNPFFSRVKFEFTLTGPSEIQLEIYNYTGEKVFYHHELRSGPGDHHLIWNAGNCRAGTYIYRFKSHKDTFVGKILKAG